MEIYYYLYYHELNKGEVYMFKKFFNWIGVGIKSIAQKIKYAHESQSNILFVGYIVIFIISFINTHRMHTIRKLKKQ